MFADGTYVTVLPWYLIPGRPYPVQIYLYACELYISSPEIGQRGAAESTRKKFKLKTFSHSTVSRSFRSFEEARKSSMENKFGAEIAASGTGRPMLIGAAAKNNIKNEAGNRPERRFPAVIDTFGRRKAMRGFLPNIPCGAKRSDIESVSNKFVEKWHKKTRRLLL